SRSKQSRLKPPSQRFLRMYAVGSISRRWILFSARIFVVLVLFASIIAPGPASQAQGTAASAVSAARLGHLRRGINLSEWFAQVYDPKGYTKEHFENWTTAADIALIKSAGFDHVRLSVNPWPMMEAGHR